MGVLGIDIGGVIISRATRHGDTSFFSDNYLATPAIDRAFESIGLLRATLFHDDVHLVSKASEVTERKTRHWLEAHGFHEATGVARERVHFCRKRSDKAPICAALGVTAFVDDSVEVLAYLTTVERRLLFGAASAPPETPFEPAATWADVVARLRGPS